MAKKRGNGEGSIYRCKDRPGYRAAYTVQTARGPRRCYVSGKTRREVEEKLTKAKAERDGGLVFDSDSGRLGSYLEGWLDDVVRNTVKQRTLENYAYIVRRHITPELGRVKVKDLRPDWVRRLYREKLDSGLSTRTVRLVHPVRFGHNRWAQGRRAAGPALGRRSLAAWHGASTAAANPHQKVRDLFYDSQAC